MFLFVNKKRDRIKILWWDNDGLAIFMKRLEAGTYQLPAIDPDQVSLVMDRTQVELMLAGIELSSVKRRKRRSEALPPHLPRKERIVEPPKSLAVCPLHGTREVMGYDVVEKLIRIPAVVFVEAVKYPKLFRPGCPACGVVSPERPTGLVEHYQQRGLCAGSVGCAPAEIREILHQP
jgi:transposase